MATHPAVDALQKASKGLSMPSESDAPFEGFLWDNASDKLTQDQVVKLAGAEEGTSVEEDTLDGLFRTVPSEDKARFQKLAAAIKQQLSGVKVYKVGDEAEREVYVVGKTQDGKWAGLKTSVVET
jgi:histidine triad (HIT) family protein